MPAKDNGAHRRAILTKLGYCLNGLSHGKATVGVRCQHCHDVHRYRRDPAPIVRLDGLPSTIRTHDLSMWAARMSGDQAVVDDIREEAIEAADHFFHHKYAPEHV